MDDLDNLIVHVRHSSSGVPIGFVGGDVESDGDMDVSDTADSDQFDTWITASVRCPCRHGSRWRC